MPLSPDLSTYEIIRIRGQTVNFKDPQSGALPLDSDRLSWNEVGEQRRTNAKPTKVWKVFPADLCSGADA